MATIDVTSPVKRDRQKKLEQLRLKKNMRENLPVLTKEEIRRCRLPYHEALLKELEESGFPSAAGFLRQLIQFQEDLRKEHGPDSAVSARPRLLECKKQLEMLYEGLKNAEQSHYNNDVGSECDELIKMAAHFGLGSEDWWWLGEQLLVQAVNVSSCFQKDGGKRHAIAKYIYGKFILENLSDADLAKEQLTEARKISSGKSWTAKMEMGYEQDTVFIECCLLLHQALLIEAREIIAYDPQRGSRVCAIARKRAADACDNKREADALMLQGLCEIDAGDAYAALQCFTKVLVLNTKINKIEGICEARIHIALAYLKIGKFPETLEQLEALLSFAEENKLPYYIAQAHRFLGEYYLNQGVPSLATPLLIKALHIFHELEDILNREQARNLAAISAGQELIQKYIDLILKCGIKEKEHLYLLRLVNWKDSRELFWSEESEASQSSSSHGNVEQSSTNLSDNTVISINVEESQRTNLTEQAINETGEDGLDEKENESTDDEKL